MDERHRMLEFVHEANVRRLQDLLTRTPEGVRRDTLKSLLAEEMAKGDELARDAARSAMI